jgi:acetyl-CoA acetyltransferase
MIADPLHLLDCCVIPDGGAAFIMTIEDRARDLRQPPVYVLGASGASTPWHVHSMPDFGATAGGESSTAAYRQAGVTPEDIDTIQFYDSFTITALLLLEDHGFCAKGEGGAYVDDGHLHLGGKLPLNTDGGGLLSCHSGMRGTMLITEAVRQLRGQTGAAQVSDCELALAAGCGGLLSYIGLQFCGVLAHDPDN